MYSGTCPKCEHTITRAVAKPMPIEASGVQWQGIVYKCPDCEAVLGVSVDPFALKAEIVREIKAGIEKPSKWW